MRRSKQKVAEIRVGDAPNNVAFSPDSKRAFVANRLSNTVSVIDVETRKVVHTIKVGSEPHGVMTDAEGKRLYVLNTSSDDIWVFDAQSLNWTKTLSAGKAPWALALSPDGRQFMISNMQARFAYREPFVSEATAVETDRAMVAARHVVPGRQPHDGRGLAPERPVRAHDHQPHQEPGADDEADARLDYHERPGGNLARWRRG